MCKIKQTKHGFNNNNNNVPLLNRGWISLLLLLLLSTWNNNDNFHSNNNNNNKKSSSSSSLVVMATSNELECLTGWWGKKNTMKKRIPLEWINDGYCDCPIDGADEPNTNACSGTAGGAGGWAGIPYPSAEDAIHIPSPRFTCPEQPTLKLPLSRINDGICDCCDGADETSSNIITCTDNCNEVLAQERAAKQSMIQSFEVGYAKRQLEIQKFTTVLSDITTKITSLETHNLPKLEQSLKSIQQRMGQQKMEYIQERRNVWEYILSQSIWSVFNQMSMEELMTFILSSCQFSGEIADSSSSDNNDDYYRSWKNKQTCMPLRLAALDIGFLWEKEHVPKDFSKGTVTLRQQEDYDNDNDATSLEIQTMLYENSKPLGIITIGKDDSIGSSRNIPNDDHHHHRRHRTDRRSSRHIKEEEEEEEDYYHDDDFANEDLYDDDQYGDYNDDYSMGDDDIEVEISHEHTNDEEEDDDNDEETFVTVHDDGDDAPPPPNAEEEDSSKEEMEAQKQQEENMIFFRTLKLFSSRELLKIKLQSVLDAIDRATNNNNNNNDYDDNEEEEEEEEDNEEDEYYEEDLHDDDNNNDENEEERSSMTIDPMALQMVRGTLSRWIRHIEHGEEFVRSAKVLLDSLQQQQPVIHDDNILLQKHLLKQLAVGIILYGQINESDVAELIYMSVPELHDSNDDNGILSSSTSTSMMTCGAPLSFFLTNICPPSTKKTRSQEHFPDDYWVQLIQLKCDLQLANVKPSSSSSSSCTDSSEDNDNPTIPSNISEGQWGYYVPKPHTHNKGRDEDNNIDDHNTFTTIFQPFLRSSSSDNDDITRLEQIQLEIMTLEEEEMTYQKELNEVQNEIKDLYNNIGGEEDGTEKFGMDGELYAMSGHNNDDDDNSCFIIHSGKYDYELCPFGKAKQADHGNSHGTSLGSWLGMEYLLKEDDEFSDQQSQSQSHQQSRVMKWIDGDKCWNGPKRSATAYVSCGAETIILTADEPETCSYVFTMESHIACDEKVKSFLGL